MNSILQDFVNFEISKLASNRHVDFGVGDIVVVKSKSGKSESSAERLQAFEGICIAKRNRGLSSSFKLRKICKGVGVEKSYRRYSPLIVSIDIVRKGKVRRAALYYIRNRIGKSAKVKQDFTYKASSVSQIKK